MGRQLDEVYKVELELMGKEVTHDYTILRLEKDGDEIVIYIPHDLDDVLSVGQMLELKLTEI
jgi:hypothetical protein